MSVQAISWAYEQKCGSPFAKFLLITLANYANDQNEAWPSRARLAEDMGCCDRTVRANLVELQAAGLIDIEPRFQDGVQLTNKVRLVGAPRRGDRGSTSSPPGGATFGGEGLTGSHSGDTERPRGG